MRVVLALSVVLTALFIGAAGADEAGGRRGWAELVADAKALERCVLRDRKTDAETCVGLLSTPCLTLAKDQGSETQCFGREGEGWMKLADDYAGRVVLNLAEGDRKTEFAEAQQAWSEHRDKSCTFLYSFFDGSMASPMAAACIRTENARRALYLVRLVDYAEGLTSERPPTKVRQAPPDPSDKKRQKVRKPAPPKPGPPLKHVPDKRTPLVR